MLKKRIIDAINKTPFYYKRGYKITENIEENYPIITKSHVVNSKNDFRSEISMTMPPIIVSTSGSSGYPVDFVWNPVDYCSSLMEIWKLRRKFGVSPTDNFVTAHISFHKGNFMYTNKVIIQRNALSLSKVFFDEDTLLYYYNQIIEFKPVWMLLPPSFLYGFVSYLERRNMRLPSSIKLIELTGEYCTNELYSCFKKTYPEIVWRLLYGMQEFNVIGYGVPDGLHILKNNVAVEILSDKNTKAKVGEEGSIIVTGLKNTAMPLVRYETGDYGYIDSFGLLHITKSRSNDILITENGIYDGSLFWLVILKIKNELKINILQFQVVLENSILQIYLKIDFPNKVDTSMLKDYIINLLSEEYSIKYTIDLFIVDKIQPNKQGNKIKFFINQLESNKKDCQNNILS